MNGYWNYLDQINSTLPVQVKKHPACASAKAKAKIHPSSFFCSFLNPFNSKQFFSIVTYTIKRL